jgi:hypothetical protein
MEMNKLKLSLQEQQKSALPDTEVGCECCSNPKKSNAPQSKMILLRISRLISLVGCRLRSLNGLSLNRFNSKLKPSRRYKSIANTLDYLWIIN